jgi:hypothetical protein
MQSHKTIENLKSAFVSKSLISDFLKGGVAKLSFKIAHYLVVFFNY